MYVHKKMQLVPNCADPQKHESMVREQPSNYSNQRNRVLTEPHITISCKAQFTFSEHDIFIAQNDIHSTPLVSTSLAAIVPK